MHPRFINTKCPECQGFLTPASTVDKDAWGDEWICPNCYDGDGIYIDFEPELEEELNHRMNDSSDTIPWEEVRDELYKRMGLTEEEIKERLTKTKEDLPALESKRILNFDKK